MPLDYGRRSYRRFATPEPFRTAELFEGAGPSERQDSLNSNSYISHIVIRRILSVLIRVSDKSTLIDNDQGLDTRCYFCRKPENLF
jgi:hypothetical protein